MHVKSLHLCLTFRNSMDCNPPSSSVHGILHVRTLAWIARPSCRGSSSPRDWALISSIDRKVLYHYRHHMCMYMYIYICICPNAYIYMYIYIHTHTYIYMYMYMAWLNFSVLISRQVLLNVWRLNWSILIYKCFSFNPLFNSEFYSLLYNLLTISKFGAFKPSSKLVQ